MARASIQTDLSLDTTRFQRGLAKSEKGIKNFVSNGIKQFGALAGAAGLGAMAKSAIDLGSKISDMAVQLNIGATELQVLEFAAREAGVEVSVMERALRNVQLRTQEAINGNKSYGKAFERLGIDINAFNNLPTEKKLEAVAVAQSKATDKAAAFNDVAIILGQRAGPAMQEVLQNLAGPKGYGGLEAAAKRANEVMSDETIAKMDKAADTIESFKRKMTVLSAEVLGKVIPAFSIFGNGLGSVGDIAASLIGKFSSFLGFLGRSVSATIDPVVKQFQSLAEGLKGVALSFRDPAKASEAFKKSLALQKGSVDALLNIPKKIAAEYKRANEEMAIDNKMLDRSMKERADNIEKAWAEMWGKNVKTTKKANKDIAKSTVTTTGGGANGGSKKIEKLKEKIKQIEMARIRAEADGNKEAEASLARRLDMAKEIVRLMELGFSRSEATKMAQGMLKGGGVGGGDASTDKQSLSDAMARAKGNGIRFQKMQGVGGERYNQRFFNGQMAGRFSDDQLIGAAARTGDQLDRAAEGAGGHEDSKEEGEKQQKEQTEHLKEISETLTNLDRALSGD